MYEAHTHAQECVCTRTILFFLFSLSSLFFLFFSFFSFFSFFTLPDYTNGLSYGTPAGCDEKGEREGICASFQYRCGDHSQLKSTSASIVFSGATVAEKKAVCCDPITPANAAFFDKCSTITTRTVEYTSLAPEITFCGAGKEYDATKAESTCAAGQCNQITAADVTTCCKASTPCVNTDGTSANAAQCQVRTHTHTHILTTI